MYRKEKSSWKPPFGLLVFVLVATLTALFVFFTLLRVGKNNIRWGNTEIKIIGHYNYLPIIIAFLASFLPLLAIPIGKKMRDHQYLFAFTLFLTTTMIFFVCQGFSFHNSVYKWASFFDNITLYTINSTSYHYNAFGYLQLIGKYALCFLPLLAFPIANLMHKKSQGSKTLTIFIMLLFFTCWSVNLYLLNIDQYGLNWLNFTVFDADGINIGLFYFLGVGISAFLPMIMLGVGKAPEKVIEKHYIEKRIIYCPIERNDRD